MTSGHHILGDKGEICLLLPYMSSATQDLPAVPKAIGRQKSQALTESSVDTCQRQHTLSEMPPVTTETICLV